MTCKDCLYFKRCVVLGVELDIKHNKEADKNCRHFENKADYIKVVRCEKCKYGDVSIFSKTKDGQETIACYCKLKNRVTDVDSYCPSGKRKLT